MTWTFDSGLLVPIRTTVQTAVVAKLAPLLQPVGFLETVIGIGFPIKGSNDLEGMDMLWSELGGRTPAIAVFVGDCKDEPAGAPGRSVGRMDVEVYYCSGHRRGKTEGRATTDAAGAASNRNDPGLHAALELGWMFLFNAVLAPKRVQPLVRHTEEHLITSSEASLWVQRYTTQVTLDVNTNRGIVQQLTQLHTTLRAQNSGDEPATKHIVEDSFPDP